MGEPENLKARACAPGYTFQASQHVVIDIMSFHGVLHECVQKIDNLWKRKKGKIACS